MCGIAGWVNLAVAPTERRFVLERMCEQIRHRGPDDQGFYMDEFAALGMQRLSIVDLAGGHQPMASEDGRIQIVFNGEIFNHASLRSELRDAGASFQTHCDTEVILRLYEGEGLSGCERMNGMFAIAIWDRRSMTLHLVRDRLGVKPLYYAWDGRSLVFGSEIKAILACGHVRREINPRAIWDYLTFRYVPAPDTIWRNVHKLPAAHVLSLNVNGGTPRVQRWWDFPTTTTVAHASDSSYEAEFASLFDDAVRLRMLADVPVGITLSGGLDSSAVAAAARAAGCRLETFSVAFAESPQTNELPFAREVARHLGASHHEVVIGQKEFMDFLPHMQWYTDEPLADLASVPLYYVSRLARQHVKVVLSGEGSDEVLAGYDFDRVVQKWQTQPSRGVSVGRRGLLGWLRQSVPQTGVQALLHDQLEVSVPLNMTNFWSSEEKRQMLHGGPMFPDSMDAVRQHLRRLGKTDPLMQVLYVYCQDWLVEDLLMKADRMSMANSLELRTPFLDYRLVEWAARLPTRLKVGRGSDGVYRTKEILRRYAATRLPSTVVDRPKQGFPVPVYQWLADPLAGWARDTLGAGARLEAWFTAEALKVVVEKGVASGATTVDRHRLWNLLILEIWAQQWLA